MFIEVSKDLYGNQAKNLSESIFNIFDEDQSGHIDFLEYMMVIMAKDIMENLFINIAKPDKSFPVVE